jgi:uncharacterized protein with ACT and thioredoxin-like domain
MRNRVVIVSDGNITKVVINGIEYGDHITGVGFHHDCNGKPQLKISTDTLPPVGEENLIEFRDFLEKVIAQNE